MSIDKVYAYITQQSENLTSQANVGKSSDQNRQTSRVIMQEKAESKGTNLK
jgi:hypothetical protein